MKKTIIYSGLLVLSLGLAQAEPGQNCQAGGSKRGHGLEELSTKLNLSDEQKAKLQPIMEAHRQTMKSIRGDASLSKEQQRAKAQQAREALKAQLSGILTPEQLQQFEAMKPQGGREGHGGPGGRKHGGKPPGERGGPEAQ